MDEHIGIHSDKPASVIKSHTACFTGHRRIETADLPLLQKRLEVTVEGLIRQDVIYWGCGGAIGFDVLAGFTILKFRGIYPAVRLIMVLPCHGQESKWSEKDKEAYWRLLSAADKTVYVSDSYDSECMARRNLHLVEHSAYCVAYLKHWHSGTAQTVRFAQENGLTIINLACE